LIDNINSKWVTTTTYETSYLLLLTFISYEDKRTYNQYYILGVCNSRYKKGKVTTNLQYQTEKYVLSLPYINLTTIKKVKTQYTKCGSQK
jgi:hypothetical protein